MRSARHVAAIGGPAALAALAAGVLATTGQLLLDHLLAAYQTSYFELTKGWLLCI